MNEIPCVETIHAWSIKVTPLGGPSYFLDFPDAGLFRTREKARAKTHKFRTRSDSWSKKRKFEIVQVWIVVREIIERKPND